MFTTLTPLPLVRVLELLLHLFGGHFCLLISYSWLSAQESLLPGLGRPYMVYMVSGNSFTWVSGIQSKHLILCTLLDLLELLIMDNGSELIAPPIRARSELPPKLLPLNISQALEMALEQKELDQEPGAGLDSMIRTRSSCQNPGCDAVYQGLESDATPCTYHPGAPRFHEGMKSWSCCGIQTLDFGAFLTQPGCRVGRHDWGKQMPASCRQDWHQTDSLVVVTVYGQIPLPAFNWVKASQTELHVHIVFDGNRVFQAQMKLWGVPLVGAWETICGDRDQTWDSRIQNPLSVQLL
ncbi:integrin beta-1-binding protein 2 isoform X1 [Sorex araneus]|uniref:integrin beta-1-binding protein 2 isoform X1 n=1 Tax=Sorex araneus TaxID=42254 RepID=UPI002433B27D|nr:integrin beta-1-binding protein 2 isoform X1 [Sorex araneus]